MKLMKKFSAFILLMLMSINMLVLPVMAASITQDGLEVTWTSEKKEYTKDENVAVTLTVTNTNGVAVTNVSLESLIPEGYQLQKNSQAEKVVKQLDAGETVSLDVVYAPVEAEQDKIPPNNVEKPESDNPNSEKPTPEKFKDVPPTGDQSTYVFWIVAVSACGLIICIITLKKKKHGKNLLSVILCITVVGTGVSFASVPVEAAEVIEKEISISETIKIAVQDTEIKAIIKYQITTEEEDDTPSEAGEITFSKPSPEHVVYDEESQEYFVDNELLVTTKENVTREEFEQIIASFNGNIIGFIELTNDYQVELPEKMTRVEITEIINQLKENELIEEAMIHSLQEFSTNVVPNDTEWAQTEWSSEFPEGDNWGVEAIDAMGAWDYMDQMTPVKVGVIDSMFDVNHEDLKFKKVWNNPDNIYNERETTGNKIHGTHVSGTIAATYNNNLGVTGVAPKSILYAYSALGTITDDISKRGLISSMEYKYALTKLIASDCRVINVSMGLTNPSRKDSDIYARILETFLAKLINKGYDFLIVQAAGNDGRNHADVLNNGLFVGITDEHVKERIMVVGAVGTSGSYLHSGFNWFGHRVFNGYSFSDYSNCGERVDVVAPGDNIVSTLPGNKYANSFYEETKGAVYPTSGTSMAAPHVSGIASLCFSVNPKLTATQVKNIIINTADTTVTDNNKNHEKRSYPFVNAKNAVELAITTKGESISPVNPSNGFVLGNVRIDTENYTPVPTGEAKVSAYRISDHDGNLSEYASSTVTDEYGNFELILEAGKYYINVYQEGYIPFVVCDVVVAQDETNYLDNILLLIDHGDEVVSTVQGTVKNALNGDGISGATVKLRPGWDNRNGELAHNGENEGEAIATSDQNGKYVLRVKEGGYTAEVSKEGYVTGYVNVVCTQLKDDGQDAVLTPILTDDEYRVVLTWSENPNDLDSHLSGPLSTGGRYHVFYSSRSAYDNGQNIATLDRDDTSSYGPETITLKKNQDGVYKYSVQDYSNKYSNSSTVLSMSGAKVELYCGNTLIQKYNVPINTVGTVWNVFEIEGNDIRVLNTMENISDPSCVTMQ